MAVSMFEPTLSKLLTYLEAHPQGAKLTELSSLPGVEAQYVEPALDRLLQGCVLSLEGGVYKPHPSLVPLAAAFAQVCRRVRRTEERRLIVRGLLVGVSRQGYLLRVESLVHVLAEEGFDPQETKDFLTEEIKSGYLSKSRVCFRSEEPVFTPPPFLPVSYIYYSTHGYMEDYEVIKERWRQQGLFVKEDDYLMADYPQEIAGPSKQYLDEKRGSLRERLRREAYHTSV